MRTENRFWAWFALATASALAVLLLLTWAIITLINTVDQNTRQAVEPIGALTSSLSTQVAEVLNPTPTILPSPVTILREVRSLARLETIQYSVEKVIEAETGQGFLGGLFGDRLLLVARGYVIAGIDLEKIAPEDMWVEGNALYVRLPAAEVFVATLDNAETYIYDRETGLFSQGNQDLETLARQSAEEEIRNAALEDNILQQATQNGRNFLSALFDSLGYETVIFVDPLPTPSPTP